MSSESGKPPKRHLPIPPSRPTHTEEGDGNWLVSYADMMTLLVGFFVILLSFSKVDQDEMEAVRREISHQFGGTYTIPFGDLSDRIREALKKLGLGDQFIIRQTDQGVEISFLGTVFFKTGSADVRAEARGLLSSLIGVVKAESAGFNIIIEGHTDDNPVNAGMFVRNNWELSSIRACRVLEAFSKTGFPSQRLTAIGYGEARPIVANQSQNRRVVIKLITRPHGALSDQPDKSVQSEQ